MLTTILLIHMHLAFTVTRFKMRYVVPILCFHDDLMFCGCEMSPDIYCENEALTYNMYSSILPFFEFSHLCRNTIAGMKCFFSDAVVGLTHCSCDLRSDGDPAAKTSGS